MTIAALQASITHWEKIVAGEAASWGTATCALCEVYFPALCEGCPVAARTGQPYCRHTPYSSFTRLSTNGWAKTEVARWVAEREVTFLKSLLPHADAQN